MLGKDTVIKIKTGSNYDPIPQGQYTLQVLDVELKREVTKFSNGQEVDNLNYKFAILNDVVDDTSADGQTLRGRYLWKKCSLSINKKSWLGKLVKAVYGRDLTEEELSKFHPDDLINHQVDVLVQQDEGSNGNVYSNIISFSNTKKLLEPISNDPSEVTVTESKTIAPTQEKSGGNKPPWEA